jgi:hypothetical protein
MEKLLYYVEFINNSPFLKLTNGRINPVKTIHIGEDTLTICYTLYTLDVFKEIVNSNKLKIMNMTTNDMDVTINVNYNIIQNQTNDYIQNEYVQNEYVQNEYNNIGLNMHGFITYELMHSGKLVDILDNFDEISNDVGIYQNESLSNKLVHTYYHITT